MITVHGVPASPFVRNEGLHLVRRTAAMRRPGPYQIQAAISAAHAESLTPDATDWPAIVSLYDALARIHPSPVVTLNRAVAVAMRNGPAAGLAAMEAARLSTALEAYQPFHCAHADLLRRLERQSEAARAYRQALVLTHTRAERLFLERQLARLDCDATDTNA